MRLTCGRCNALDRDYDTDHSFEWVCRACRAKNYYEHDEIDVVFIPYFDVDNPYDVEDDEDE